MTERNLTKNIAKFMQVQFPNVIYKFDLASDQRLSIQQATRNSQLHGRWSRGSPDMVILAQNGSYGALFIELKVISPYKKNGELKKSAHLSSQANFHEELEKRGYKAIFTTGFEETIEAIREYLSP